MDLRQRRKGTNPSGVCKAMNTLHTAAIINLAVTLRSMWAGKNPTLTSFDRSILLLDVTQQIFFDVRLIEHLYSSRTSGPIHTPMAEAKTMCPTRTLLSVGMRKGVRSGCPPATLSTVGVFDPPSQKPSGKIDFAFVGNLRTPDSTACTQ